MSVEFIWQLPGAQDSRYANARRYKRAERLPDDVYSYGPQVTDPRGNPGYWNGSVRASYGTVDGNWKFTGFVNNVTDKSPVFLRQIVNPNTRTQPNSFSAPRTWGVQVN